MGEGKLPNFKKLAGEGGFYRLETSTSPESPTSWASFATGGNAGKHNIFDFLVRDMKTYVPDLGMVRREMPDFFLNYVPLGKPKITTLRGGTSFWVTAGEAGVRSAVLTVPVTFPPEDVPAGELLSGLPLPDIRGTIGTFYYFATDLSRYEEGNTEMGGILKRLDLRGRHRPERARRAAQPDRAGADGRTAEEGRDADRGRPGADGGARGPARRPDPVHGPLEPPGAERHDRHPGHDRAARRRRVEQVGAARVPRQLPGAALRHGAVLPGARERRTAALRVARQLAARVAGDADLLAGRSVEAAATSGSARTARSAGPRRPGR